MRTNAFLVLLLLVLAGCQGIPGFGFPKKDAAQLPEVSIGTQGVELSIAPTLPREVFERSPFTLLLTLSNLGTADVEEGVYSLSYDPQYLSLIRQQGIGRFAVQGKSPFNPQGAERQLIFVFDTKPLGPQLERYPATMAFAACYPYTTTAPLVTCIDTDLTGKRAGKVCTPQPQSFAQGQGAPVAVATVESRMLPGQDPDRIRPEFVLTLKNLGGGDVVAAERYRDACSGRPLGEEGWNVISVEAMLSDSMLTCTPTPVKLKQAGETRVVCTLPDGIDARMGTYTAPLIIALRYGYLKGITAQVSIIKPTAQ